MFASRLSFSLIRKVVSFSLTVSVKKKMSGSILIQKFNPVTGTLEWELQEENYDYTQEVARAGFGDMLHDEERNLKYNLALQKAIQSKKSKGQPTRVLDIGTGTGLLSIMAAQANPTSITACETFQPMVKCAREVIIHNQCQDKIKLIPKRSTDVTVGATCDMNEKANILVTEVLDTELIGEGAIGTYNHAHKHLLTDDSISVPARATIFVQLVECPLSLSWNRAQTIKVFDQELNPPPSILHCPGNGAVHDIQLAQLNPEKLKFLSDPVPIFKFDWNSKKPIPEDECKPVSITATASGTVQGVLMWWSIDMDREGEIVLSCAPPWAHPEGKQLPWRDHWMQAIYYLPSDFNVQSAGEKICLMSYHDEYSLWFGISPETSSVIEFPRPFCSCPVHNAISRTRLGQLNDVQRNQKFVQALEKVVTPDTICLTLGDCCLLSLIVAKLGARKVYAAESNLYCRRLLEAWVKTNGLEKQVVVMNGDFDNYHLDSKVNLLLGEPVFQSSVLPWHNLYFAQWRNKHQNLLHDDVTLLPGKARIYAIPIQMKDLWKIRAPVKTTQKVDLYHFDKLIKNAIEGSDAQVEPHPLWEYPSIALSQPVNVLSLDLTRPLNDQIIELEDRIVLPGNGCCNGVALWVDWELNAEISVSGGPIAPVVLGENIQWDINSKQGVYFLPTPVDVADSKTEFHYQVNMTPSTYELKFSFSVQ